MLKSQGAMVVKAGMAEAAITGKKFCSHHQGRVDVAEGGYVWRGKVRRWICFVCQSKSGSKK